MNITKRIISFAVFVTLLFSSMSTLASTPANENIAVNSDMTDGITGWDTRVHGFQTLSVDNENTYQGLSSLKVEFGDNNGADRIYQVAHFEKGKRYIISFNAKNLSGTTDPFSAVVIPTINRDETGERYSIFTSTPLDNKWQTFKTVYRCETNNTSVAAKVAFNLGSNNNKTLLINNFTIVCLDSDAPKKNTDSFRDTVFVDGTNGNDNGAGTKEAPYKTIQKARDAVRTFNQNMQSDITVYLRGGNYYVSEAIAFDMRDSGTSGHNIIYKGYENENPVIQSGKSIVNWSLYDAGENIFVADSFGIEARQFYVNSQKAVRARSNGGLENPVFYTEWGYTTTDTSLAKYKKPSDLEFNYSVEWTSPMMSVDTITEKDGLACITMKNPIWAHKQGIYSAHLRAVDVIWYENAYELLDEPGEWYLSRDEKKIYYKPRVGEDMQSVDAILPTAERLITANGNDFFTPVENITFQNINFAYATWNEVTNMGFSSEQNSQYNDENGINKQPIGNIEVNYGHNIDFYDCDFSHLGATALKYNFGVQNCDVKGNRFYDIASHAVMMGDNISTGGTVTLFTNPANPACRDFNNSIVNNYISTVANEYHSSVAISFCFSQDMTIEHNEIYNVPYSGVHIGWGWNQYAHGLKNLKLRYNYIHDYMTHLRDGGGIYSLGLSVEATPENPNIWSENYLARIINSGASLYNDQGSSHYLLENNVIENKGVLWDYNNLGKVRIAGFGQGGGWATQSYLTLRNNWYDTEWIADTGSSPSLNDSVYGNKYVINDLWPKDAVTVMENAGLTDEYKHLADDAQRISMPEMVSLRIGEEKSLVFEIYNSKDVLQDNKKYEILYESSDKNIVTVDEEGRLKAVGFGKAKVFVKATSEDITQFVSTEIVIDDGAQSLNVIVPNKMMLVGSNATATVTGRSTLGIIYENITDIEYLSSNENVVTVDKTGIITSVNTGNATINVKGIYEGKTIYGSLDLRVVGYTSTPPTEFGTYDLKIEIADIAGWKIATDAKNANLTQPAENTVALGKATNGTASSLYTKKAFLNEILEFDMEISAGSTGWPSIQFRASNPDYNVTNPASEGYIICFTSDKKIELQRFNGAARTAIFCMVDGENAGIGDPYNNDIFRYGDKVRIRVGAINEANGVRLILYVNDVCVFDYLDTDEKAVRNSGYFGMISPDGVVKLSGYSQENTSSQIKPNEITIDDIIGQYKQIESDYKSEIYADIKGHSMEKLFDAMLRDKIPVTRSSTEFGLSDEITRGEFLNTVINWIAYYNTKIGMFSQYALDFKELKNATTKETKDAYTISLSKNLELLTEDMIGDTGYNLDEKMIREDAAFILYNAYTKIMGLEILTEIEPFLDETQISSYAVEAVRIMRALGYINGVTETEFSPKTTVTREQTLILVLRLLANVRGTWSGPYRYGIYGAN